MRAGEALVNTFSAAGSTAAIYLDGGVYCLAAHSASWGGGNVTVDMLLPDGTTWFKSTVLVLSADGYVIGDLPPGQYRLTLATTTAANVAVTRVPRE